MPKWVSADGLEKEVSEPIKIFRGGASACAPKKRADTRVRPYRKYQELIFIRWENCRTRKLRENLFLSNKTLSPFGALPQVNQASFFQAGHASLQAHGIVKSLGLQLP